MAIAKRRVSIANPARRRRNMSPKQIKFFGTPAQKAGLKRSRAAARHRSRTRPAAKRRNFGEIVSLSLGAANPARRKVKKMAQTKRRAKRVNRARSTPRRNRRRTRNPVVRHRRRTSPVAVTRRHRRRRSNPVMHHRRRSSRRNPLGQGGTQTLIEGVAILSGLLGSKYVAQLVLGTSNTGILGYGANLVVGGIGAWGIGSAMKKPKLGQSFFVGSVIEVIIRALEDYTPFGTYVSGMGVGDYFASNFVNPQRYTDALNSANVQIPAGWAPTTVIQSSAAPAGAVASMGTGAGMGDGVW